MEVFTRTTWFKAKTKFDVSQCYDWIHHKFDNSKVREVARAGYFSKYHTSSSKKVFGTIVVERVIDLIMLGLVFIIALFLQADRETFNQLRQTSSAGNSPEWLVPLLVALVIIVRYIFCFYIKN